MHPHSKRAIVAAFILAFSLMTWAAGPLPPQPAAAPSSTLSRPAPKAQHLRGHHETVQPGEHHRHKKLWTWIAVAAAAAVTVILIVKHNHGPVCENCVTQ